MRLTYFNLKTLVVVLAVLILSGCANSLLYHEYVMSGQIVDKTEDKVVVCTADTTGVEPGQVIKVFRTEYDEQSMEVGDWAYTLVYVGSVQIDTIRDGHFAEATILSGDIVKYDMVELKD